MFTIRMSVALGKGNEQISQSITASSLEKQKSKIAGCHTEEIYRCANHYQHHLI